MQASQTAFVLNHYFATDVAFNSGLEDGIAVDNTTKYYELTICLSLYITRQKFSLLVH